MIQATMCDFGSKKDVNIVLNLESWVFWGVLCHFTGVNMESKLIK